MKNCFRSHTLYALQSKQHIGNPISEANACIGIYLWSSPVPVLKHNASKNVRIVTLWYKDITATSLSGETMMTNIFGSDEYYHKGIWYSQTFSSQLLRGRSKNQFFHSFGLLHDLLRRQDLPNSWFERRLKLSAMFLSIFRKGIFTRLVLLFEFPR